MWRRDLLFTIPIVIIKLCHHWPVEERLSRSYCPIFFFNTNPNSSRIKRNYEIRENAIRKKKKKKRSSRVQRKFISLSLSSNHSDPSSQHLLEKSSKSNRIESNRVNSSRNRFSHPDFVSNFVLLSLAHSMPRIRVWWPWLYLRRRKRRITLNLSPLLVIARSRNRDEKRAVWLTRSAHTSPPPSPSWYLTRFGREAPLPWSPTREKSGSTPREIG